MMNFMNNSISNSSSSYEDQDLKPIKKAHDPSDSEFEAAMSQSGAVSNLNTPLRTDVNLSQARKFMSKPDTSLPDQNSIQNYQSSLNSKNSLSSLNSRNSRLLGNPENFDPGMENSDSKLNSSVLGKEVSGSRKGVVQGNWKFGQELGQLAEGGKGKERVANQEMTSAQRLEGKTNSFQKDKMSFLNPSAQGETPLVTLAGLKPQNKDRGSQVNEKSDARSLWEAMHESSLSNEPGESNDPSIIVGAFGGDVHDLRGARRGEKRLSHGGNFLQPSAGNDSKNSLQAHLSGGEFLKTWDTVQQKGVLSSDHLGGKGQAQLDGLDLKSESLKDKNGDLQGEQGADGTNITHPSSHPAFSLQDATLKSGVSKPHQEVIAQVTQGSMAQNRFSTTAMIGITAGIRNLSLNGGGEIRVRLKPENLGELHIRVMALGNKIELQIQASDDKAKKVLEDSINFLKDSLSAQHLTLAHLDLSVMGSAASHSSGNEGEAGSNSRFTQNHSTFQDGFKQNSSQNGQNQQSDRWGSRDENFGLPSMSRGFQMRAGGNGESGAGRPLSSRYGENRIDVRV